MIRLHRESALDQNAVVLVDGEEAHYLSRVLRIEPGETIAFFWGDGKDHLYQVETVERRGVVLSFVRSDPNRADPPLSLTLVQAMPKAGKLDDIIRGAAALGVSRIIPFNAVRSIGRGDARKTERRRKIAAEAARQCGRTTVPAILDPARNLEEALEAAGSARGLFFWEESRESLSELLGQLAGEKLLTLVCGPEGGLTEEEAAIARAAGLACASLGPRILRAELAPLAALTAVQMTLGDMG